MPDDSVWCLVQDNVIQDNVKYVVQDNVIQDNVQDCVARLNKCEIVWKVKT